MTILEEAEQLAGKVRSDKYGHPFDNFTQTGKLWAPALDKDEVTPEQVALCMILAKISRLTHSPDHADSLVDIAGYARAYEMVRERRDASDS